MSTVSLCGSSLFTQNLLVLCDTATRTLKLLCLRRVFLEHFASQTREMTTHHAVLCLPALSQVCCLTDSTDLWSVWYTEPSSGACPLCHIHSLIHTYLFRYHRLRGKLMPDYSPSRTLAQRPAAFVLLSHWFEMHLAAAQPRHPAA